MRYLKYVLVLGIGFLFTQCAKFEPEVVQFNEKYNPKQPTKGKRDTAPEVDLLHLYASFDANQATSVASIIKKGAEITVKEPKSPELNVQASFPVSENVEFKITYDKAASVNSGKLLLPEAAFTLPASLTISKGAQEVSTGIKFKTEELKKLKAGEYNFYVKLSSDNKDVKFKDGRNLALVTLIVKEGGFPEGNNIEEGNPELGNNLFNDSVIFTCEQQPRNIDKLFDNDLYRQNWWTNGEETTLIGSFSRKEKVSGIVIANSQDTEKALKKVRISVADESGEFVVQGVYITTKIKFSQIKFKQPVEIMKIRFDQFESQTGNKKYIDIFEIRFAR
ncbi:DUF1735 domain-containing protein [Porphyromonas pogonae]|uniref:DUF1735 domain-containing protein n=1 Tax=Porphyromonas pogonae TaxID=867595 RepID=UPI002E7A4574|nr:DUF1735 domain-containing protein [Porphyromonas pogonae]